MLKTILIVDTDPITPILVEHWLLQTGVNVVCAHVNTVAAMVQYIATNPILELIILEPFLNEYDERATLEKCQQAGIFQNNRVGLLSILHQEQLQVIAEPYSVLFALTKPVTNEVIILIDACLSH